MVHNALKEAGILQESTSYPCSHEGWARKNVLLINTALTIETKDRRHLDLWKCFIVGLLNSFVWETIQRHTNNNIIYVMLWGYDAKSIWKEITSNVQHERLKRFIVMNADHPANPNVSEDKFIEEVSKHFDEINNYYPDIFSIKENSENLDMDTRKEKTFLGNVTPPKFSTGNYSSMSPENRHGGKPPYEKVHSAGKSNARRSLFTDINSNTPNENTE